MKPVILTIAGSDGSGGAGLQADLKTIEAAGCWAASAVTAITAQNTHGVHRVVPLDAEIVRAQVAAVVDDLFVDAVKIGMLASASIVDAVADLLERHPAIPVVLDPVLAASSGGRLTGDESVPRIVERLIPRCTVLTPNAAEATRLSGVAVSDPEGARRAAELLIEAGARNVLVTGGHFTEARATDVLVGREGASTFEGPWIDSPHTHGTGCVLSSAIAVGLARGENVADAVRAAKRRVTEAIRRGWSAGEGPGSLDPTAAGAALRDRPIAGAGR